jgi:hypothetical protein
MLLFIMQQKLPQMIDFHLWQFFYYFILNIQPAANTDGLAGNVTSHV